MFQNEICHYHIYEFKYGVTKTKHSCSYSSDFVCNYAHIPFYFIFQHAERNKQWDGQHPQIWNIDLSYMCVTF